MIITNYQKFIESVDTNQIILGKIYPITNGEFVITHDCKLENEEIKNSIKYYTFKCINCGETFTMSSYQISRYNKVSDIKEHDDKYQRIPCYNKLPLENLSFREFRGGKKHEVIHINCELIESSNSNLQVKCNDCGQILTQSINGGDIIKDYILKDIDKRCIDL